jgi:hypothetical protein
MAGMPATWTLADVPACLVNGAAGVFVAVDSDVGCFSIAFGATSLTDDGSASNGGAIAVTVNRLNTTQALTEHSNAAKVTPIANCHRDFGCLACLPVIALPLIALP